MPDPPPPPATPAAGWFVLLDGGLVVLALLASSGRVHASVGRRVPLPPRWALGRLLALALAVHVAEAAAAARLARRGAWPSPPGPSRRWSWASPPWPSSGPPFRKGIATISGPGTPGPGPGDAPR